MDKKTTNLMSRYMPIDADRVLVTDYGRIRHRLNSYTKHSEASAPPSGSEEEEEESGELQMLLSASKGRYYALNHEEYEKCFNCQEQGHISKNCPNKSVIRCHYCLGNHKRETCEVGNCFCCSQEGHRSSNCPYRSLPNCRRCFKKGHKERECRILVNFREVSQRTPEHLEVPSSQLLCLNCGKSGHLQCYLRGNEISSLLVKDGLYEKENLTVSAIQLDIPTGVVEDDLKANHPGVIFSANQRRRKLNELVPDEAEEMTLDQFKKQQEEEYERESMREALGKRKSYQRGRDSSHHSQGRQPRDWVPHSNWKQQRNQKKRR